MYGNLRKYILKSINNKEVLEVLINKFTPLIKKYSIKLKYDGAETDLLIRFIEIINLISKNDKLLKNERIMVSYINKSIINYYIYLSKKNCNLLQNEALDINENLYQNVIFSSEECSFKNIELIESLNILNCKEKCVLVNLLKGYSISEISKMLCITRQAVNKIKLRAFSKLRELYNKQYQENSEYTDQI